MRLCMGHIGSIVMNPQAPSPAINTQAARRSYVRLFGLWAARGLSPRAAGALALAGCETIQEVTQLGRVWFLGKPNCGTKTLRELAILANWAPETPVEAVAAALSLSIADPEEAHEAATDALMALRRSGYVIAAKQRSTPAGRR